MKLIFFGSSQYVVPVLDNLRQHFEIALVVTTEKTGAVPAYCVQNHVPYMYVERLTNTELAIKLVSGDIELGILADFGLFVPEHIIKSFPKGILNIHPSLLPKYRGPTPVQTAIKNGDTITGVSIIQLDNQLDHGSIIYQQKEPIHKTDTNESLYNRLFVIGSRLLIQYIPKYMNNEITLQEQNHSQATYTNRLTREDGYFDLKNPPKSVYLERIIRAFHPWPGAWTTIDVRGKQIRVKFLPNKKVQVEGKKPVAYKDFLNGFPELQQQLAPLFENLKKLSA